MKTALETQVEKMVIQIDEVFARQRRIETLLHRVAEQIGVTRQPMQQRVALRTATSVEAQGWDTPIGHIKRALEETGNFPPTDLVGVYIRDALVAEIDFIS